MEVNGRWVPPNLQKLYRRLDDAFKICTWFGYNPQINFELSRVSGIYDFYNESYWTVDTFCAQFFLQYYSDSFETNVLTLL